MKTFLMIVGGLVVFDIAMGLIAVCVLYLRKHQKAVDDRWERLVLNK